LTGELRRLAERTAFGLLTPKAVDQPPVPTAVPMMKPLR
jgi:hypothetical protein